jgi:hypothetical protein
MWRVISSEEETGDCLSLEEGMETESLEALAVVNDME